MVRASAIGCLLSLLFQFEIKGQNLKIDSLLRKLDQTNALQEKSDLLHSLASEMWDYDFDRGREYATEALRYAKESNYKLGQVKAITDLGMHAYFTGDYKAARKYYDEAIELAGKENFGDYPSYTYTRMGNLFRVQAEFDSARWYYLRSLQQIGQEDMFPVASSSTRYNLGMLNIELAEYPEALVNINKALQLRQQLGDSLLMAECWKSLGIAYKSLSEFANASANYQLARKVAIRFKNPELEMFCDIQQGELAFLEGDHEKSITLLSNALEILKKHNFKRYYAQALQHIGRVFVAQGDYEKALVYYFDALRLNEELGSTQEIARTQIMVGWTYAYQRNYLLAFEYAYRALSVMKRIKDREGKGQAENLLGQIHFRNQAYDSSLLHYEKALQLRKEIGAPLPISNTAFNMARVYEAKGDFSRALNSQLEIVKVHERFNNELTIDYNSIGALLIKMGRYAESRNYLIKAFSLAKKYSLRAEERDNYKYMAQLARAEGNYREALTYSDQYIALNDSLTGETNAARVNRLNALYQLEKKEREIQLLSRQNQANKDQLELQSSRLKLQNAVIGFSVVGLLLVTIVAIVLYRYNRSKAIANRELTRLNREVREQNEEIQAQTEELSEAYQTISATNKTLEEKIDDRTLALRQAYKELDTFFYRSSHDFRRPLTTFQGLAEVAKVTLRDAAAIELFNKVNETARGVDRMLNKLQSVSLIASSELTIEEVQFESELDYIFEQFRPMILEKKIRVTRIINLKRPFRSYPALIRIILENLIENSIQFAGPLEPHLQVSVEQAEGNVLLTVSDNGEGIAEEFHNRIFDMYFRANEKSRGNGLGLYIVRKAVEKLKGSLTFKSCYAEGSSFSVKLPVRISAESQEA